MKKRVLAIVFSMMMLTALAGCGETKEIKPTEGAAVLTEQESVAAGESQAQSNEASTAVTGANGYEFSYNGVSMGPDMDASVVVAALGDPVNYFEAASCAFEGLDKIYTYADFEIDTYPSEDKDLISAIILKDDLVITEEGAYIGMSADQITKLYGDQTVENGMLVYTEGDMKLKFIFDGDTLISIEYDSKVLDLE